MDIQTFETKLNELNLTKKEFANMVGAVYNGVVNWNTKGETPKWVDSWLENYENVEKKIESDKMLDIRAFLTNQYNLQTSQKEDDCLKLNYKFNNVSVNLYFDIYDVDSIAFHMILIYEESYYYTALNIDNIISRNQYLTKVPENILFKILTNGSLDKFYNNMRQRILEDKFIASKYSQDIDFKKVLKNTDKDTDEDEKPFLYCLRKTQMSEKQLEKLYSRLNIARKILWEIKKEGYTIVTTSDFTKRKKLILILKDLQIKIF
ncbi:acyl carrier protein [Campylobacter hyointestinalis]|uniref:hypothetical protein n=1 Tax=Campylobacter hyointestinalis TaxID=198 RepID=UPI0007266D68|nr:hypothetical protein [Campylobacter hyointestinalis]PPB55803.1 hypothetical protein CDQ67_04400 [Campylobacter hyointestinalis subsp. hyointestinalis]CUU77832.1 acyl carrier protein [Campylobacter hyointestinalis]CUU80316.1 acyl carrier protein [Campylobacter hyointestinalis subsp. hyointestinalis]